MGGGDERKGATTVPDGAAPVPTKTSLEQQYGARLAPEPLPTRESAGHEAAAYHAAPRPAPAPHRTPNVIVAPPVETPVPKREVTTVALPMERTRAWWLAVPVLVAVPLVAWWWAQARGPAATTGAAATGSATVIATAPAAGSTTIATARAAGPTAIATAPVTGSAISTATAIASAPATTAAPPTASPALTVAPPPTPSHAPPRSSSVPSPASASPSSDPHPKSHLLSPE